MSIAEKKMFGKNKRGENGGERGIPSQKREGNSEGVSAERTHKVEKSQHS
jgi:hypothetical protein